MKILMFFIQVTMLAGAVAEISIKQEVQSLIISLKRQRVLTSKRQRIENLCCFSSQS